jgi:hypothetical protein
MPRLLQPGNVEVSRMTSGLRKANACFRAEMISTGS